MERKGKGCLQRDGFSQEIISVETPSGLLRRDADRLGRARCTEAGPREECPGAVGSGVDCMQSIGDWQQSSFECEAGLGSEGIATARLGGARRDEAWTGKDCMQSIGHW